MEDYKQRRQREAAQTEQAHFAGRHAALPPEGV